MDIKHLAQIAFALIIVAAIIVTVIKVMKADKTTSFIAEGTFLGLIVGSISGYYILSSLICAPIGMFLGLEIGRRMKKDRD